MNDYLVVCIEKYAANSIDNKVIIQRFQNLKTCKMKIFKFYVFAFFFMTLIYSIFIFFIIIFKFKFLNYHLEENSERERDTHTIEIL